MHRPLSCNLHRSMPAHSSIQYMSCIVEIFPILNTCARYNGLAILWEHRFYGQSLPFPVDADTGLCPAGYSAYQYLTTEQALEDVVYFAEHFKPTGLESHWQKLAPGETPWIFIGGSYPGARAAFIRIRNPDVIYASWASSGPVQATVNMATYSEQVYKDLTANCSADIAAASAYLDNVLTNGSPDDITQIKGLIYYANNPYELPNLSNVTEQTLDSLIQQSSQTVDSFYAGQLLLTVIPELFQNFGFDAEVLPYCNVLEQFDPTTIKSDSTKDLITSIYSNSDSAKINSGGIAATYGSKAAFMALLYTIGKERVDAQNAYLNSNTTVATPSISQSWNWQFCSECVHPQYVQSLYFP